ncbi:efflux RND transporter periplasmic adaptor subunit [Desulfitobacterium sp.]|uniref:efflux RND transporter periplasmic adaptor subunit n=1 Tax=Desulfitobacterium sp. TaxID=49981 RepID=UPI002D02CD3C|nr:efflux RND transporter periplasmic adaptor subunit [Desulfitobacterium sp.]HVJ49939.1 efflux RND transporter periplasmic adaptor subunit [Desulfitobacterium sp.]
MKKQKTVRLLVATLGVGLVLLTGGCGSQKTAATVEEKYIPVEVLPAAVQTLVVTTNFSGKVDSNQNLNLVPKMPGKVSSVQVKVGDVVNAGMVLFTLESSDLQKAVDMASIGVRTAETNYQQTKEQIDLAKMNLERQKQLYEAGAIPKAQLETSENQASETPLQLAQIQWDQAKLSLQQAQDALNNAVVTAPLEGTVTAVNIKPGEMASSAQPAVTLTQLNSLYVALNVPENIVNWLQLGQDAKVTITSADAQDINGKIASLAPAADARTMLYAVKVAVDNPEGKIKPGMFAKVGMMTQSRPKVLAVNSEAIVTKNGKPLVYVIENETAVEKEVTTGLDTGSLVEVSKGLQAEEQVVIKGQTLVEQGSKVKIVGGSAS